MSVTAAEVHEIQNQADTIKVAPGITITELQRRHVGVVLDLFQAKGTMSKLRDNFVQDAVYEDLFAKCKNLDEVAGQLLGLPVVTKSSTTLSYLVDSIKPSSCEDGTGASVPSDEISVDFKHRFEFKLGGKEVTMHSTLLIWSSKEVGKIIRLQDRPLSDIPDYSILTMNAIVAPTLIGIPAGEKEDAEKVMKFQR
ncbi:hypothetical protein P7C73_g1536, partial [Tremellales sp. Uapishka_1]